MTGFVNCFCPRPDIAVLARPRKLPVREHAGARGRAKELARGQSGIRATPYKCPRYPCKCSRDPVTLLARPYGTFARGQKAFASEHPDARSTPTNARVRTPPMAPQTAFTLAASFTCSPCQPMCTKRAFGRSKRRGNFHVAQRSGIIAAENGASTVQPRFP